MKRTLGFSALFLGVLLILAGCSSSNQASSASAGAPAAKGGRFHMPDFGQPQRQADLRGVVTSIVGNQVTMLKIALNSGRRASSTSATTTGGSSSTSAPALSLGGSTGGRPGGGGGGFYGGGGPGGAAGGANGTTNRATMIANLKAMSTGSETIIVPVGIKMMKSAIDPNTQKRTMVEANLSDIAADKMITVWLNASVTTQKVAEFVLINN